MKRVGGEFWCRLVHPEVTWPVNGHYRCKRCRREYRVPWEDLTNGRSAKPAKSSTSHQATATLERAAA